MTKHAELIARLEALTGPDREVDWRIAEQLDIPYLWPKSTQWPPFVRGSKYEQQIPLFTGSIDCAVSLCERILPGWRYIICPIFAEVKHPEKIMLDRYGHGANPAIALLIATLKALDAKEQS